MYTPKMSRAGKNPHGSTTYTFTDAEGNDFHVLPCNDEPGNPDRKQWEVYADDGKGSSNAFEGTYDTLAEIRDWFSSTR